MDGERGTVTAATGGADAASTAPDDTWPARDVWLFFALTYGWSWLLWLPGVLAAGGWVVLPRPLAVGLGSAAVFGPAVAAFGLTAWRTGRPGLAALWRRGWAWRFRKRWLVPILLLLPGLALLTVLLLPLVGEAVRWDAAFPPALVGPVFLALYLSNALPEEYGWRGYALERLQRRGTALGASLLLGLLWGLWHLPLHFTRGTPQEVIPVGQFVVQHVGLGVLYTWIYNNTGGSVLAAALLHAAGDTSAAALPFWATEGGRLVYFGLLVVAVGGVVLGWGPRRLVRGP